MEEPGRLYSAWGHKESDMTERLQPPYHLTSREIFSLQRFQIKVGSSEEFKDSLTLLFIGIC